MLDGVLLSQFFSHLRRKFKNRAWKVKTYVTEQGRK